MFVRKAEEKMNEHPFGANLSLFPTVSLELPFASSASASLLKPTAPKDDDGRRSY